MENYSRAIQATGDNMTHVHYMLATKATNTHSECVINLLFLFKCGSTNATQYFANCLSC